MAINENDCVGLCRTESCKICGELFAKRNNHQKYCCDKCKKEAERRRLKERYFDVVKPQKKKERKVIAPSITIDGMVALMLKLSKERGRVVQYGEVQAELITGKLKLKEGTI